MNKPTIKRVGGNRALVFSSWPRLNLFLADKLEPKLGERLKQIWIKVYEPCPGNSRSGECWLLFHRGDFNRVIRPVLRALLKGKALGPARP